MRLLRPLKRLFRKYWLILLIILLVGYLTYRGHINDTTPGKTVSISLNDIANESIRYRDNIVLEATGDFLAADIPSLSGENYSTRSIKSPRDFFEHEFTSGFVLNSDGADVVDNGNTVGFVIELALGNVASLDRNLQHFDSYYTRRLQKGDKLDKVWFIAYRETEKDKCFQGACEKSVFYTAPDPLPIRYDHIFGQNLTLSARNQDAIHSNKVQNKVTFIKDPDLAPADLVEIDGKARELYKGQQPNDNGGFDQGTHLYKFVKDHFDDLRSYNHLVLFLEGDMQLYPTNAKKAEIQKAASAFGGAALPLNVADYLTASNAGRDLFAIYKKEFDLEFQNEREKYLCRKTPIKIEICLLESLDGTYLEKYRSLLSDTVFKDCDLNISSACF